jgi:uncharacterized glyoxalase superfamily protein PhnB
MPQLNAAGIVSSDMARSIGFYRALGLDVPDTPGEGHLEATSANGFRLMLDSEDVIKSFRPEWTRSAAGFEGEKEPWDAFWGQRYAQLADPDGVPVDLFAAL